YNFRDLLSQRQAAGLPAPDLASPLTALAGTVTADQAVVSAAATGSPASASEVDAVASTDEHGSTPVASENGTDLHVDIAGLTLRNGQIHMHDKKNGYVAHIANLEL